MKYFKNNAGYVLMWILALIPLVIWYFMRPLDIRFGSSGQTLRSLGQLTGLLGMALLSLNFVLSARFKFLDRWFAGLNNAYVKHHIIGALSFCFLLFHPTFLFIQYLFISLKASFDFIFSVDDWPIVLGDIALLVIIGLMVITFYLNFKHENWKKTHQYLGLVLFLGGFHMFLVPSDISNNNILKFYMITLAVWGAYAFVYRTILGVYKKGEFKYRLMEVLKINESVVELKFKPLEESIKFLAGQFVFLRFDVPGILSESHPFSIASAHKTDLSLGVKALGDYTSMVYLQKPGVVASIEGPFGAFSYLKAKSKRQIWVAGGIGVTPFLSMARDIDISKNTGGYEIDFYYSAKNDKESAFGQELVEISAHNPGFKFYQHFSDISGYISADFIAQNIKDIVSAEIFLCGPVAFMKSLREQFIKIGFDNRMIHSEEFSF
ncbi:MAG: ferric reductase-like transmembrane domain-containing protein [Candidatus Paceibacterota bacterium]|jgi:predicted ferric reductase